jgi:phosphoribosylformylglycinamidine synthase
MYSESQGRLVVTVNPTYEEKFEQIMEGNPVAQIGKITNDKFIINGKNGNEIISTTTNKLNDSYKSTFRDY